jgi:phosphodiesterase/alkaline phosphatase D-like protein
MQERRAFLKSLVGAAAGLALSPSLGCREPLVGSSGSGTGDGWDSGEVVHLLPTSSHERILLKASFRTPQERAPRLVAGERSVAGARGDSRGHFWAFDLAGLAPATRYDLELRDAEGAALCEPWPLRTLPAPDARPERLRLLVYTCAGGPENLYNFGFWNAYVPIAQRQRMLRRALSFEPDAVVANGDHVYWDLQSRMGWAMGRSWRAAAVAGRFDREQPVLGTLNEDVLLRAFGPQLAGLYGVMFRSLPVFFLQDDHDYGENDEASDALRTFPADAFALDLARTTQRLYYPELLADPALPRAHVSRDGRSESYGSLRFGRLFEALLYDCRRGLSNATDPALGHATSGFVPPEIEHWLLSRTGGSPCAHLAHMPSTPVLWGAGKWGEWYPDFKDESGALRADVEKPYWAPGWADQHDRLLTAASARRDRTPLFVSGDLHAIAAGRILGSRGRSFRENPVVSVLVGAPGTGPLGWPSQFRGQVPVPSGTLQVEEIVSPLEENGFTLLDVTEGEVRVSQFRWTPDQGEEALDTLEPFAVESFPRPGS